MNNIIQAIEVIKPDSEYRQINHWHQITKIGYELLIDSCGSKYYMYDGNFQKIIRMGATLEWFDWFDKLNKRILKIKENTNDRMES